MVDFRIEEPERGFRKFLGRVGEKVRIRDTEGDVGNLRSVWSVGIVKGLSRKHHTECGIRQTLGCLYDTLWNTIRDPCVLTLSRMEIR